jgi:alkaline phosphatase D
VRPSDAPQKDKSVFRTYLHEDEIGPEQGNHENSSIILAKRRGDWSGRGVGKASQTPSREMEGAPRPISGSVASGDPDDKSVILLTRAGDASVGKLFVEVAEDENFRKIVTTATAPVSQAADGNCRVLAGGLKSAHVYWFRFMAPDGSGSRIGRTITAPAPNDPRPVRFAL